MRASVLIKHLKHAIDTVGDRECSIYTDEGWLHIEGLCMPRADALPDEDILVCDLDTLTAFRDEH